MNPPNVTTVNQRRTFHTLRRAADEFLPAVVVGFARIPLGNRNSGEFHYGKLLSAARLTVLITLLLALPAVLHADDEPKTLTNSLGITLVRIEPGSFTMGQDGPPIAGDGNLATHHAEFACADWDEKPAHRVTITRPFYMGVTEVTLGQFRAFDPDFRKGKGADDDAVHAVTWTKAVTFCEWLTKKEGKTYRLPTEAEWEYACRAGSTSIFHTGDMLPAGHQKWFGNLGWRTLYFPDGKMPPEYAWQDDPPSLRVAQETPNAWGLHDIHGNLAEWCLDWYGPYEAGDQIDPLGRRCGDFRVFRGGGHSMLTRMLRSANRGGWIPDSMAAIIGFRVVQADLPKGKLLPPPTPPLNAQNVNQEPAKITPARQDDPVFEGPRYYRRIPAGQVGPLFARHNHSPAITECPNGDLLAVWFSCISEPGPELCNGASRLRLGAKDWEPPSPFWDAPDVNDHAPKLWWDGEKTLIHFAEARGFADNIMRTSTDNGATWSQARVFFPRGETSNHLIRLHDGTFAIAIDSRSLMISHDNGLTWTERGKARGKTDLHPGGRGPCIAGIHAAVIELTDGRLMAMGRFDDVADQERFGFKMPVSYSSDLGETWHYESSNFPVVSNTQRPVLLRLREGPIVLCSFTDQARALKNGGRAKGLIFKCQEGDFTGVGLFAAVSYDEGKTWPDRRLITPGSSAKAATNGYLAITQTRDGRIQLITSSRHYIFNLAWLIQLPKMPKR